MAGAFKDILPEPHDLPQGAGAEADASSEEDTKPVSRDPEPSVGAAMHGTGECKPCAWFWKPKGCLNGEDCMHCHLCPSGALKVRKHQKKAQLRHLREAEQSSEGCDPVLLRASPHTDLGTTTTRSIPEPMCVPLAVDACSAPPGLSLPDVEEVQNSAYQLRLTTFLESRNDSLPGLKPSASVGSAFHSRGSCKPCAWYWHPKGCMHGEECEYCHECLPGELKTRKKMKIQSLRATATSERSSGPSSTVSSEELSRAEKAQAEAESSEPCHAEGEASVGSAEHASGQCRPCAFFWKPGGCENGKDCLHCHLCAPGELQRKKKEVQQARARRERSLHGPTMNTAKQIKSALSLQQQVIQQQQQQLLQMQMQLQMQQQLQAQMMMTTAANFF
eukprot:TRINITY_DN377_c0_g1_i8.p1 TRINITY_DN377_c0_g1~~TRINITY_DN377_c0_g1_i8.p1  ORF type:complete len:390 (+),score=95.41 TRINITY_DN377_c0_g1_i8:72-1241(+)